MQHPMTAISPRRKASKKPALADRPFQRMGAVKSFAGAIAATGALLPPAIAVRLVNRGAAGRMPILWHRIVSRSLGVRTHVSGTAASGSVLFVCNHISWLDIPVLGSRIEGSFVAKAEVEQMGMVGFLADMQETIYVDREQKSRSRAQANDILERLRAGGNVILFPEGTSNDGVRIQPVSLAYTHLNGLPLTRHRLMDIAWVGDMELGSHALDFMRLGRIDAAICFHEPVRRADFSDRKALARHCQSVISGGYRRLMRGRA